MMTEQLLSPDMLLLIDTAQAERRKSAEAFGVPVPSFVSDIDALCRTLRAAWAERDTAIKTRDLFISLKRGQTERADELYIRGLELVRENAALREQLARLIPKGVSE